MTATPLSDADMIAAAEAIVRGAGFAPLAAASFARHGMAMAFSVESGGPDVFGHNNVTATVYSDGRAFINNRAVQP